MKEAIIQDAFAMWLRKNHIAYIQARRDQRSTIRKGWPDFTLIHCGHVLLIETKTAKGKLSEDQKTVMLELVRHSGMIVHVCRSVEECVSKVNEWMGVIDKEGVSAVSHPESAQSHAREAPGRKKEPSLPMFVAPWSGAEWVFGAVGKRWMAIRRATPADIINLPTRQQFEQSNGK